VHKHKQHMATCSMHRRNTHTQANRHLKRLALALALAHAHALAHALAHTASGVYHAIADSVDDGGMGYIQDYYAVHR